jgi:hypothetical protein
MYFFFALNAVILLIQLKLTWSLICEFLRATQTRSDLNLGPKVITVGRLRLARCVASWSTAHSRFAFDFSPKIVTSGPLFKRSLGSTLKAGGQLKKVTI